MTTKNILKYLNFKDATIKVYKTIDSTNNYLKKLASTGAKENSIVIALQQTNGKGTRGRSFYSEKGGVYLSILIKPNLQNFIPAQITTAAAVAVNDAILEICGVKTQIKWVNDIYLNDKKVCGILCESLLDANNNPKYVIVGIGINLFKPENNFCEEIRDIATYISESNDTELQSKFTAAVIDNFYKYYNSIDKKLHFEKYRNSNLVLGKEICIIKNNEKFTVKALQIDDQCRLLVQLDNGEKEFLSSGDVSICKDSIHK